MDDSSASALCEDFEQLELLALDHLCDTFSEEGNRRITAPKIQQELDIDFASAATLYGKFKAIGAIESQQQRSLNLDDGNLGDDKINAQTVEVTSPDVFEIRDRKRKELENRRQKSGNGEQTSARSPAQPWALLCLMGIVVLAIAYLLLNFAWQS
jgi:hypothetical protein